MNAYRELEIRKTNLALRFSILHHDRYQQVLQPLAHTAFISTQMRFTWTLG